MESGHGGVLVKVKFGLGQVRIISGEENNFHSTYIRTYFPSH